MQPLFAMSNKIQEQPGSEKIGAMYTQTYMYIWVVRISSMKCINIQVFMRRKTTWEHDLSQTMVACMGHCPQC